MLIATARSLALDLTLGRWSGVLEILVELAELSIWVISDLLLDNFDLLGRQLQV